jgi:TM2 domain-containing membrane protein YozV/RNA polymerase subunit RPABC4/transcription elongation factor Spt4
MGLIHLLSTAKGGLMYCTNCGQQVDDKAIACPKCGVPPLMEKKFCHNCGTATQANQIICVKCGVSLGKSSAGPGGKNRIVAGVLGILLGWLGIHKFYLGYTKQGLIMLLVTVFGSLIKIGPFVMALIGLIEGIIYLVKSDEDFYATYVQNKKKWF